MRFVGDLNRFEHGAGHMLCGLVPLPLAQGSVPSHIVLEVDATDNFLLVGATSLLEAFSQAQLVRFLLHLCGTRV